MESCERAFRRGRPGASERRGAGGRGACHDASSAKARTPGRRPAARRSPRPTWRSTRSCASRLLGGAPGLWLAVGGDGRRSGAAAARDDLRRRSDRRHARLHRRRRPLVREPRGGARAGGRSRRRSTRRRATSSSPRSAARARGSARDAARRLRPARRLPAPGIAGPRGWLKTAAIAAHSARISQPHVPSLAYRLTLVADGARSMPPSPARAPTTGTLRPAIFWCTKRAAGSPGSTGRRSATIRRSPATACWRRPIGSSSRSSLGGGGGGRAGNRTAARVRNSARGRHDWATGGTRPAPASGLRRRA